MLQVIDSFDRRRRSHCPWSTHSPSLSGTSSTLHIHTNRSRSNSPPITSFCLYQKEPGRPQAPGDPNDFQLLPSLFPRVSISPQMNRPLLPAYNYPSRDISPAIIAPRSRRRLPFVSSPGPVFHLEPSCVLPRSSRAQMTASLPIEALAPIDRALA